MNNKSRFQELFKPEQLLILRSEQLFADSSDGWTLCCSFWELMSSPAQCWIRFIPVLEKLRMYHAALKESLREQLQPTYRWMRRSSHEFVVYSWQTFRGNSKILRLFSATFGGRTIFLTLSENAQGIELPGVETRLVEAPS